MLASRRTAPWNSLHFGRVGKKRLALQQPFMSIIIQGLSNGFLTSWSFPFFFMAPIFPWYFQQRQLLDRHLLGTSNNLLPILSSLRRPTLSTISKKNLKEARCFVPQEIGALENGSVMDLQFPKPLHCIEALQCLRGGREASFSKSFAPITSPATAARALRYRTNGNTVVA